MNRTQAAKLWSQAFAVERPEERFRFLSRLKSAAPQDVLRLAAKGRRRFDEDDDDSDSDSYLFAKTSDGNTLLDGVEVHIEKGSKPRVARITTFATMTIGRIPGRFYVKCHCTGQSGIAVGGHQVYLGRAGTGKFIPELERAVPTLTTYKSWGFNVRCYWTEHDVLETYGDWLAQVSSPDSVTRNSAIVNAPTFAQTDFSSEARRALGNQIRPAVLDALASDHTVARTQALRLVRDFDLEATDTAVMAAQLMDSQESARRSDGIKLALSSARTPAERLNAIRRHLSDSDRNLRLAAARSLENERMRVGGSPAKELHAAVAKRLKEEPDTEVSGILERFQINFAPLTDHMVQELCQLVDVELRGEIRNLVLVRLKQDGGKHALVSKTALKHFDAFPIQAADILIAAKDYSSRTNARMSRLADDPDWSLRWRYLDYVRECPKVSAKMIKLVQRLQADPEFTVRESADRLMRNLKRRKSVVQRRAKSRK
jgi:hypothetical protein